MSLVLEYAARPEPRRWDVVPPSVAITMLTFAHLHLCWQLSRIMLIPVCQNLGHNFIAWTPVAWLPGCLVSITAHPFLGSLFIFLNSLLAAGLLQEILCSYHDALKGSGRRFLRDWRVYVATLLWFGWIPVPSALCFIYQFGTWANTHG